MFSAFGGEKGNIMACLQISLPALEYNITSLRSLCSSYGCAFMLVFKEAAVRPELFRRMREWMPDGRFGLCDFPRLPLEIPAGLRGYLLYLTEEARLPTVAENYFALYQTSTRALEALYQHGRASGRRVRIILPVELGDGRDGILPEEAEVLGTWLRARADGLELVGVSANFACIGAAAPTMEDLGVLLDVRRRLEAAVGYRLEHVSIGGSDVLALAAEKGGLPEGISEIRCGTAAYLGVYPLDGRPVPGLRDDAVRLLGRVVESRRKGGRLRVVLDVGTVDTCPERLRPLSPCLRFLGASSGYSVLDATDCPQEPREGDEIAFGLDYRSLAAAFSSGHLPLRMVEA